MVPSTMTQNLHLTSKVKDNSVLLYKIIPTFLFIIPCLINMEYQPALFKLETMRL